jgi:hypothetical protein
MAVGTIDRLGTKLCVLDAGLWWVSMLMLDCGTLCACGVVGLIGSGGAKERLLTVGGSVCGDEQCSGVGAVGSFDSVGVITTGLGLEMRTAVMLTEEVPGNSTGVLTC